MKMPNSVCWNITSRCNDKCLFCYRDRESKELNFDKQKKIIQKIAESGIRKVTFAGGEPLLVEKVQDLILYANKNGLITSLTTNGILLNHENLEFCVENLSWITFSLDSTEKEIQSKMGRNSAHVERTCRFLDEIAKRKNKNCQIKINTVVSCINQKYITDIADLVMKYSVSRWKLFQFVPLRGSAREYAEKFNISDESFLQVADHVRHYMGKQAKRLTISGRLNIESAYFVIFPNGDIKISTGLQDQIIGNALNDDLKTIWHQGAYQRELHEERTKFMTLEKENNYG